MTASRTGAAPARAATITDTLASFVVGVDASMIPAPVMRWTSLLVLDAVATAIGNRDAPFARAVRAVVAADGAAGPCTLLGSAGIRLGPEAAAEANSSAIHGSDLDATHIRSIIHPTAIAVPVGLAVAEATDATGAEALAAIALGMECLIRLGLAAGGGFHVRGFQPTALLGPMAGALVAARLHARDPVAASEAAGLATSIGAGLRSFSDDGTWGKRLITGWACRAAIHADALVAAGFRGSRNAAEKRWGMYAAFLGEGSADLGAITDGLGEQWTLLDTEPKRFPCSHGLHPFIEAARVVREGLAGREVTRVECTVNSEAVRWWFEPRPARYRPDPYAARFSIPYTVARALVDGDVTDGSFEPDAVREAAVLALAERVVPRLDPALEGRPPVGLPGGTRVSLADGTVIALDRAPEDFDAATWVEQRAAAVLQGGLGATRADRVRADVLRMERLPSIRPLLAELG